MANAYITFDPITGAATGGYFQDLDSAHTHTISVSPDIARAWPQWRANLRRDGVEPVIQVPNLPAAKAAKMEQINEWRRQANEASFVFGGHAIACDPLSRGDISGVAEFVALNDQLPPSFPNAWKAIDNEWVPVPDVATFRALQGAMVAQGAINFARAQKLKADVVSAKSIAELDLITFDGK